MRMLVGGDHSLHFPKGELSSAELVRPFEYPQRWDYIVQPLGSNGFTDPEPPAKLNRATVASVYGGIVYVFSITPGIGGQHRIRVNTLVPGWVLTEKQKCLWVDDSARELINKSQCLPDPLMSEHIANMALFLASDASAMCTAQNFIVDGGWA